MPRSDRGVAVGAGDAERRRDERRVDQRRDAPIS
jgi:hypothetical protein